VACLANLNQLTKVILFYAEDNELSAMGPEHLKAKQVWRL